MFPQIGPEKVRGSDVPCDMDLHRYRFLFSFPIPVSVSSTARIDISRIRVIVLHLVGFFGRSGSRSSSKSRDEIVPR